MNRNTFRSIVRSNEFNYFILFAIVANALLIGYQTTNESPFLDWVQKVFLGIFTVEILVRWLGKESLSAYLKNGWNWFDIIVVGLSFIPESAFSDASSVSVLRLLRVVRLFRLFKALPELQVMAQVLIKSVSSLSYAGLLFLLFMYVYAIVGVILFKGKVTVVTAFSDFVDPYGNVGEAFFSLFRILTGEDWTDLRYNLLKHFDPDWVVNLYHVSWMVFSAFLLANIVVGAVISNYEKSMEEREKDRKEHLEMEEILLEKMEILEQKLDALSSGELPPPGS